MINVYWGLFVSSLIVSLGSFVIGGLDLDFEFGDATFLIPIKPFFILLFMMAFGGTGIILTMFIGQWLAFIPAVVAGYIVAKPIDYFFTVKMRKYEANAITQRDTLGTEAVVIEAIKRDSYGQIQFILDDKTLIGTAKMDDDRANGFSINDKVYITRVDSSVYYVTSTEIKPAE